jgi:mono/diheme cytochrome c family protein
MQGQKAGLVWVLLSVLPALSIVDGPAVSAAAQPQGGKPGADGASVERGRQLLAAQCGFCHGDNARGGSSGPDLTRSELVQSDENGKQLGAFLRVGRPERGMPKFELNDQQYTDLSAFLQGEIYAASHRGAYKILDILVGDPKAGETFFNGAGGCRTCHSASGDLKGVAAKFKDPTALQQRMLLPRAAAPGAAPMPAHRLPNALRATVTTASGEAVAGTLVRLTDFEVTIFDPGSGQMRSWLRKDGVPRVAVVDPLQAHMDLLLKWTDRDMHNMTAYLSTLK